MVPLGCLPDGGGTTRVVSGEWDRLGARRAERIKRGLVRPSWTKVRQYMLGAGVIIGPDACHVAFLRALERDGFQLVAERPVATEPTNDPAAIYRLW